MGNLKKLAKKIGAYFQCCCIFLTVLCYATDILFVVICREELHSLIQSYLDFSLLGLTDVINTKVINNGCSTFFRELPWPLELRIERSEFERWVLGNC